MSETAAGQQVPCSHCGEPMLVPGLRELRLKPVEQTASVPAESEASFSLSKICFLGGLLILGVGIVMALTFNQVYAGFAILGLILCVGGWLAGPKN